MQGQEAMPCTLSPVCPCALDKSTNMSLDTCSGGQKDARAGGSALYPFTCLPLCLGQVHRHVLGYMLGRTKGCKGRRQRFVPFDLFALVPWTWPSLPGV